MYELNLPEMKWWKCEIETKCNEPGLYAWRSKDNSGVKEYLEYYHFSPGYEYAGPIIVNIPKPSPEPLQLKDWIKPVVEADDRNNAWMCLSHKQHTIPIVRIHHPNKDVAVLAHNAAVEVINKYE